MFVQLIPTAHLYSTLSAVARAGHGTRQTERERKSEKERDQRYVRMSFFRVNKSFINGSTVLLSITDSSKTESDAQCCRSYQGCYLFEVTSELYHTDS